MRMIKYMIVVIFIFLVISGGYISYLMFWPFDPLTDIKITVKELVVNPGGRQCFTVTGMKLLPAPADVLVEMVNGELIPIMSFSSNESVGRFTLSRCFNVPYQLEPPPDESREEYAVRLTAVYHVNPLNDITEVEKSNCFRVKNIIGKALKDAVIEQDKVIKENTESINKLKTILKGR
jgi:hypothetical protein